MMPFSGFDDARRVLGLIAEHQGAPRRRDLRRVAHGRVRGEGAGALAFLQRVTANDVAKLVDGQGAVLGAAVADGCPVDDVIVYRRAPDRFLVVVNAANLAKDWEWLKSQSPAGCTLED
jgi:aminomethyltransferase